MNGKLVRGALLVLGSLCASAGAVPIQWPAAAGGNDHYYDLIRQQLYWTDANASASGMSYLGYPGHLATIASGAENAFIRDNVAVNELAWIGLTDQAVEGAWRWITGELLTYTNWNAGEPNNGAGGEDYGEFIGFFGSDRGEWNDISNSNGGGRYFVVEFDVSAQAGVPEPMTITLGLLGAGLLARRARTRRRSA